MNRVEMLTRLREDGAWDVLVVGGGATGLGVAVEAAARGYRTALVERSDFAQATSSRSTKLIHGGVRYLQQGDLPLVREALRERGLLLRNAPHLVHPLAFLIPNYAWWERPFYGIGLKMYDRLAGKLGLGPSRHLSREAALRRIPTLNPDRLRGGILYQDGQFDDARLAISLARTIDDLGGAVANYVEVMGMLKENGKVCGAVVGDVESGDEFEIRARVVINATGVFSDELRNLDDAEAGKLLTPSQGAHVVLDRSFLPGDCALMSPRTADGRVFFAIPWHGRVLAGTTDTAVREVVTEPRPLREEIEFLLEHAGRYLTRRPERKDVLSAFAGLRPLIGGKGGGKTSALSRRHWLEVSSSGLVTITGGKWTTYRQMGEEAVDRAAVVGALPQRESRTRELHLHGWCEAGHGAAFTGYGADGVMIRDLCESMEGGGEILHPAFSHRAGEVVWAVRQEMARTLEDVLARRLRVLFLDARAAMAMAPKVARIMAREMGRDAEWEARQLAEFRELAQTYLCS
jgi:glycerol-3-phosphate dehydrogenase